MGFIAPLTINEIVENLHRKKYLLPAIQREFVWNEDQITRLFDSLMRGYPIGSFLFWEVEKENVNEFQFYEFLRNYHIRDNKHNQKADLNGDSGITAILDGQQRLTALYIGLKGSYASKEPRKRWDNDLAFPKRKLYLNLFNEAEDSDYLFDFRFLQQEEVVINKIISGFL